jgi:multicomponent Na+:H+ antiporter subunit D
MPSIFIILPLIAIMALNLPYRRVMKRFAFFVAVIFFLAQIALAIFHRPELWNSALERSDALFSVTFWMDHLSFIALLSIGIVCLASLLAARCIIKDDNQLFNFINILIIASIGMCGVVMTVDIFSLYIFLEIIAVSAFILIAMQKELLALEGAFKYILLSAVATVMMLSAISLLFVISGGTSFAEIKAALSDSCSSRLATLAIGIFICGLFIKGGLVPFHGWLPDAYTAAPAPVSIFLAGIATKISGIYTLIRVTTALFVLDDRIANMIMLVGAISILTGAFAALGQNDFKRMLSFSSISQVGYIVLGFGCGTGLGIMGAIFHFFNHAIFKSLLFVNAASVEKELGTTNMDRMGGLSRKMPVTGATSVIGMLSAAGIPPLAGFWSKLIIIIALWKAGHFAYASIAIFSSLLTLAYLLNMQRKVFFGKFNEGLGDIRESCRGIAAAAVILSIITVGVGILFPAFFNIFAMSAKDLLLK